MMHAFTVYLTITASSANMLTTRTKGRYVAGGFSRTGAAADVMVRELSGLDPFQDPLATDDNGICGPNRPLISVARWLTTLADVGDRNSADFRILDDVVMDYWESMNGEPMWTPLCSSRSDLVQLR